LPFSAVYISSVIKFHNESCSTWCIRKFVDREQDIYRHKMFVLTINLGCLNKDWSIE